MATIWTLTTALVGFCLVTIGVAVPKSASRVHGVAPALKVIDDVTNYNQSQAFKSWLNKVLLTYDNRVRPYFGVRKLKIRLGLALIGISSISETDMSFSVEMFFHESWTDDRLQFQPGAFGTRYPITLPFDAPKLLWTPDTSFLNALQSRVPEVGSVSHLYSMMLHPNGTIGYSRRISVTAQCLMDLTMYPFDRQACTLELSSYGWTNDDIVYEWMRHDLAVDKLSLADFFAKGSLLKVINKTYSAGNFSVPTVCFVLVRQSGFCFLQLFVPATAVVISSWISLWLDNETQFTDIVSVILAIIFLSYSYNTVMPKVSYVKAMDIYLLACFIFVFCSLVKLAIVKYMRTVVHKRKEKAAAAEATKAAHAVAPAPIVVEEPVTVPISEETEEIKTWEEPDPGAAMTASETEEEQERDLLEPTPLLVTLDELPSTASTIPTSMTTTTILVDTKAEVNENQTDLENANRSYSLRNARHAPWQRFYRSTHRQKANRKSVGQSGERKPKQTTFKRRKLVSRAAMQQAIAQRMLQLRWATQAVHMLHLPSLHDNYWRCMKAFHLGSQIALPLAFGAFAVFYFFIYPNVRTNQGECL